MFDPFSLDDDAGVPRFRLTLRIAGGDLDPDFLTQQLGVVPTVGTRRGDAAAGDGRMSDEGEWTYRVDAPEGTELGDAVDMLLSPFPHDTVLWEEITGTYAVTVRCRVTLGAGEQATVVGPDTFGQLARFGLTLAFEFRAEGDEGDDE